MNARDELLARVVAERLDCRWFPMPPYPNVQPDDEVTCARRRRTLVGDELDGGRWVSRRGVQVWEVSA